MKVDPRAAPALYFDCGAQDRYGLFVGNEDLHRRLEKRGVSHDFALLPGDHGYDTCAPSSSGAWRSWDGRSAAMARPARTRRKVSQEVRSHMGQMHEIDYKIFGDDMQFVEVELDPEEAAVAEAGGMMYMDDGIEMETIFGDGSQQQRAASSAR